MKEAENWDKKWGWGGGGRGRRCTGVQKSIPKEEKEGRVVGWLCRHLPPALERRPLRRDRWLLAVLLLLTSALFPLPLFPFLYLLAALFIPHRPPHRSISWCSGALTVPALFPPPHYYPFQRTSIAIWSGKFGGEGGGWGAAGHSRWRWVSRGPFQFFIGVIWPSSSTRGERGCPFDFFFRGQVGRTELSVCVSGCLE